MSTLVPVLYACVRIMRADPACTDIPNTGTNVFYRTCVREDFAEYEFRTRLEEPLSDNNNCASTDGKPCYVRQPFTNGDWQCRPLVEFEVKP